jgi:hypothetical protein
MFLAGFEPVISPNKSDYITATPKTNIEIFSKWVSLNATEKATC